jgi:hypothetical protein
VAYAVHSSAAFVMTDCRTLHSVQVLARLCKVVLACQACLPMSARRHDLFQQMFNIKLIVSTRPTCLHAGVVYTTSSFEKCAHVAVPDQQA